MKDPLIDNKILATLPDLVEGFSTLRDHYLGDLTTTRLKRYLGRLEAEIEAAKASGEDPLVLPGAQLYFALCRIIPPKKIFRGQFLVTILKLSAWHTYNSKSIDFVLHKWVIVESPPP